jgi:hypothetical protein
MLSSPRAVVADANGNIYIADSGNNCVRKVSVAGVITTYAGTPPSAGFSGDGGPATTASLSDPMGLALDNGGNLYIADQGNNRIRKVSSTGTITTVAGNGVYSYTGDGGLAIAAEMESPTGVAVDSAGNLYIADEKDGHIRKVNASGTITTFAGNGGSAYIIGANGDGLPATSAALGDPEGVAVDLSGNVYIACGWTNTIRKVDSAGTISTVVGNNQTGAGFSGDGGTATQASFNWAVGVAVDGSGNVYVLDQQNDRVRMVGTSSQVDTVAGNGTQGFSGDGGPATLAELSAIPSGGGITTTGIGVDNGGNLYIADSLNNRVRKVH